MVMLAAANGDVGTDEKMKCYSAPFWKKSLLSLLQCLLMRCTLSVRRRVGLEICGFIKPASFLSIVFSSLKITKDKQRLLMCSFATFLSVTASLCILRIVIYYRLKKHKAVLTLLSVKLLVTLPVI